METYTNLDGVECVTITNADGTTWSGLKSAYDEMLAQAKQSTPIVKDEPAAKK
jgi:hypothetical protein